ncbi:MAG TPA: hypothetical protein VGI43_10140 [Mucilaginibacter sp.]|jgi:hypothetical protein
MNNLFKKTLILSSIIVLFSTEQKLFAQNDTVRLKDKRLNTSALKAGLNQYLVYFQAVNSPKKLGFWFWLRDIRLTTRNGSKVFAITQHWYGPDTAQYRMIYSVNNENDFSPVYHSETSAGKIKAYNWLNTGISAADTVANNAAKNFKLDFSEPNFNWNLDIETFETLPLGPGKIFAINFYDAGLDPPAYVIYKVIGTEVLTTFNGQKEDCWKLFTENTYKGKKYTETYWISKKGHEFLKEEDVYSWGYRYKIKMPAGAPDILSRFNHN